MTPAASPDGVHVLDAAMGEIIEAIHSGVIEPAVAIARMHDRGILATAADLRVPQQRDPGFPQAASA